MPGSTGHSARAAAARRRRRGARRRSPRSRSSAAWWAGSVNARPPANTRAWRQASSPVSSATAVISRLARRAPRRGGRPGAGPASSRCGQSADRAAAGTRITNRRSLSGIAAGSGRITRALFGEPLGDDRARGPVHARVDAIAPAVELVLEVERVREPPAGLEVAVQEAVAALQRALGLAVAGVEDHPAQRELAAEREERARSGGPAARSRPRDPRPACPAAPPAAPGSGSSRTRCPQNSLENTSAPANARE